MQKIFLRKRTSEIAISFLSEKGFEEEITWKQFYNKVCKFSNYLKSLGLKKGDRVAVMFLIKLNLS